MIALTLSGGGAKGSYELGAWTALRELNIDFNIVTGTSIGALNGGIIAQGDYEKCVDLWNSVTIDNIVEDGIEIDDTSIKKILQQEDFKPFVKNFIKKRGNDITPLKDLINDFLEPKKIRDSKIILGINTTKIPTLKKEEVIVNNLDDSEMFNYLLASSSYFPYFPICKINNKSYVDGVFTDNLPIDFAFKLGAKKVIAIDLDESICHKEYLNNPSVDYIYPKWNLGSFLNFKKDVKERNKRLGYYDTLKYYNKFDGFKYTFIKDDSYKNLAKNITIKILNEVSNFSSVKKRINIKKARYKNIFCFLNEHIYRKINDYDYFIKCIESLGVIYDLAPEKLYAIDNFIDEIICEINKYNGIILSRENINNNSKKVVNYLYNNSITDEEKLLLLQTDYDVYLSYIFLESWIKNEI